MVASGGVARSAAWGPRGRGTAEPERAAAPPPGGRRWARGSREVVLALHHLQKPAAGESSMKTWKANNLSNVRPQCREGFSKCQEKQISNKNTDRSTPLKLRTHLFTERYLQEREGEDICNTRKRISF